MMRRQSKPAPPVSKTNATLALVLLFALATPAWPDASRAPAQDEDATGMTSAGGHEDGEISRDSFPEVREMRRVMLVATKSLTVDTRGPARGVLEEVFRRPARQLRRHDYAYSVIGKRLNRYIRRHRSMTAVESLSEADFVIVFKVLNEQPSFIASEPHIYGEMFVILNRTEARARPVIVWWTKHNQTSLEDAVDDFLDDLRELRGEK
ncbi:MAG TPA: hypothetical protein VFX96_20085 [Pyrinomonadaceae bacterium]|nr:hypothetical protein [Pyrinomonadaceae bacterium]